MPATITGTFVLLDRASDTLQKIERQAAKTQAALEGVGAKLDQQQKQHDELTRSIQRQQQAHTTMQSRLEQTRRSTEGATRATEQHVSATEASAAAHESSTQKVQRLRYEYLWFRDAVEGSKKTVQSHVPLLQSHASAVTSVADAHRDASSAHQELTKGMKDATSQVSDMSDATSGLGTVVGFVSDKVLTLSNVFGLLKFGGIAVGVVTLAQAIGQLAGGFVALLPQVAQAGGALAALPQMFAAGTQAIGVLMATFNGVRQAISAGFQMQNTAGQEAIDMSAQMAQQQNAMVDSSHALMVAQRNEQQQQINLTIARRDAARQLQDLEYQAKSAALAEKGAGLSLQEAKYQLAQALVTPGTTMLQLQQLRLGVQEAQLGLAHQHTQAQRATADARRAAAGDPTSAPQQRLVQAQVALADASWSVNSAQRSLNLQMMEYRRLLAQGTSGQRAFRQAMALLPPAAQAFVRQVLSVRGAFNTLQAAASGPIFGALSRALTMVTTTYLPILQRGFASTGRVIGGIIDGIASTMQHRTGDFTALWESNNRIIGMAGRGLNNLLNALIDFMRAAQPFTEWLSGTILGWTEWIRGAAAAGRQTGAIADFLDKTKAALQQFGRIFGNVFATVMNVFKAAEPLGRKLWDGIEAGTRNWRQWTGSPEGAKKMTDWFNNLYPGLHAMGQLMKQLVEAWARIAVNPNFAKTVDGLTQAVHPLERLFNNLSSLGPPAAQLLTDIATTLADMPVQPLHLMLDLLDRLVKIFDWLIKHVPGAKYVIDALLVGSMLAKLASFATKVRLIAFAWDAVKVAALGAGAVQGAIAAGGVGSKVLQVIGGKVGAGGLLRGGAGTAASSAEEAAQIATLRSALGSGAMQEGGLLGSLFGRSGVMAAAPELLGKLAKGGLIGGAVALGGNALGGVVGGQAGGTISGAATGAGLGATIGSVVPGVGTIAGGAIGGVAGGLIGFFSSAQSASDKFKASFDGTFADLQNQQNVGALEKLARQAADFGRKAKGAGDDFYEMAARANAAAQQIRDQNIGTNMTVLLSRMHDVTRGSVAPLLKEFERLPPAARKQGEAAIVGFAREMENQKQLVAGSADDLKKILDRHLSDGVTPADKFMAGFVKTLNNPLFQMLLQTNPSTKAIADELQRLQNPDARAKPGGPGSTTLLPPGQLLPPRQPGTPVPHGGPQLVPLQGIGGALGSLHFADGGLVFAAGGLHVPGYGGGDSVTAMLEPGEFVMRKEAVRHIGPKTLGELNRSAQHGRQARPTPGGAHALGVQDMLSNFATLTRQGHAEIVTATGVWGTEMKRRIVLVQKPITDWHDQSVQNVKDFYSQAWRNTQVTWPNIQKTISQNVQKAQQDVSTSFTLIQQDAIHALTTMGYTKAQAQGYVQGGAKSGGKPRAAGGLRIPGFGTQDKVALTAPGELVVNRHTEARVNRVLGAHGTSLGREVAGETRPHGEVARFATGGVLGSAGTNAAYVNPYVHSSSFSPGRIDEGFDAVVSGAIGAIGPSQVTYAGGPAGWPGTGAVVYRLTAGPDSGKYVYLAENIRPTVRSGQQLRGGDTIAIATPSFPFTEMGWASGPNWASGTQTLAKATTGYSEGQQTAAGMDFTALLHQLGVGGAIGKAGGPGLFGKLGTQVSPLSLKPRTTGLGGAPGAAGDAAIAAMTQGLVDRINLKLPGVSGGATGALPTGGKMPGGSAAQKKIVAAAAAAAGIPAWFLWGVFGDETSFGHDLSTSSTGAQGYFQFEPGTAASMHVNPWDFTSAAYGAARLLATGKSGGELGMVRVFYGAADPAYLARVHQFGASFAGGGRVPSWGGWNAAGGSFTVNRPTLFGAGEAGRERVTIEPDRGNTTARGIHVQIDHVEFNQRGDLKRAIRQEMDDLARELERTH